FPPTRLREDGPIGSDSHAPVGDRVTDARQPFQRRESFPETLPPNPGESLPRALSGVQDSAGELPETSQEILTRSPADHQKRPLPSEDRHRGLEIPRRARRPPLGKRRLEPLREGHTL